MISLSRQTKQKKQLTLENVRCKMWVNAIFCLGVLLFKLFLSLTYFLYHHYIRKVTNMLNYVTSLSYIFLFN